MRFYQMIVIIVPLLLGSCGVLKSSDETGIKVGAILPLTEELVDYGEAVRRSMDLAMEVSGEYELDIIVEDDKCNARHGVTAYQKLKNIDNIDVLLTICSVTSKALNKQLKADNMPHIHLSEGLIREDDMTIQMMPRSDLLSYELAKFFGNKYKKMAFISDINEFNEGEGGNIEKFRQGLEEVGSEMVMNLRVDEEELDFRSFILDLKNSEVEAVQPLIYPVKPLVAFLQQAEEMSLWDGVDLAGNYIFEFRYSDLERLYPMFKEFDGLISMNLKQGTTDEFKEIYSERYGELPPQFADYAYDAITIFKRCGSNYSCMQESFDGASGRVEFNEKQVRLGGFSIKEMRDGEFVNMDDR